MSTFKLSLKTINGLLLDLVQISLITTKFALISEQF